jgi:hypothetical protein
VPSYPSGKTVSNRALRLLADASRARRAELRTRWRLTAGRQALLLVAINVQGRGGSTQTRGELPRVSPRRSFLDRTAIQPPETPPGHISGDSLVDQFTERTHTTTLPRRSTEIAPMHRGRRVHLSRHHETVKLLGSPQGSPPT